MPTTSGPTLGAGRGPPGTAWSMDVGRGRYDRFYRLVAQILSDHGSRSGRATRLSHSSMPIRSRRRPRDLVSTSARTRRAGTWFPGAPTPIGSCGRAWIGNAEASHRPGDSTGYVAPRLAGLGPTSGNPSRLPVSAQARLACRRPRTSRVSRARSASAETEPVTQRSSRRPRQTAWLFAAARIRLAHPRCLAGSTKANEAVTSSGQRALGGYTNRGRESGLVSSHRRTVVRVWRTQRDRLDGEQLHVSVVARCRRTTKKTKGLDRRAMPCTSRCRSRLSCVPPPLWLCCRHGRVSSQRAENLPRRNSLTAARGGSIGSITGLTVPGRPVPHPAGARRRSA